MAKNVEEAELKAKRREQRAAKKLEKLKAEMTKQFKEAELKAELKAAMRTEDLEVKRSKAEARAKELKIEKSEVGSNVAARVKRLEAENKALREDTVRWRAPHVAASAWQHATPAVKNVQAIEAVPGLMRGWRADRLWR